jgi:uncharacterized protein YgiB involved in biofilm formation
VAAGSIWGAKPSEQRVKIYNSAEACRMEQPPEDCAKAFADAEQEHEKSAPRLASRAACEAQYDTCSALHDATGDWFIPAMAGFMLGHALGAGGVASVVSQPVYVDRTRRAYTGRTVLGAYQARCAVNRDDPYCRDGSFGRGGGFVYATSGGGGGSSSSSGIWSSKNYNVETVRTPVMRGGFGSSASSAPPNSPRMASAPNATSSSSVTRGGFGWMAAFHSVGG